MSGIRATCWWPGLAGAWHRGMGRSLVFAIAFAWLLCVLLLATWVWPDWCSPWLVRGLWMITIVVWGVTTVVSHVRFGSLVDTTSAEDLEGFERAQGEYLCGNWFEAEAILLDIIHRQPRDAEALLLLVGVLRQTKRWRPALRRLNQLELLDTAATWRFEIVSEKKIIEREIAAEMLAEADEKPIS
ncbi:MAG: hypothetical protein R3C53_13995 [Pirellulaceae bacterium]